MNTDVATSLSVLPHGLPAMNVLLVFGVLLSLGTLGGLLAARVHWLPTITGFMAIGLIVGPSGVGLLLREALDGARVLVDIALGLILSQLGADLPVHEMIKYAPVVLAFVLVRSVTKSASVYGCGLAFGHPHRQAASAGMLLLPMAGLAIGLVQTTSGLLPQLGAQVSTIVLGSVALFGTIGPPIAALALRQSGDAGRRSRSRRSRIGAADGGRRISLRRQP